jgi:arylformamidase
MTTYLDITVPLEPGRVPVYPGDVELEVRQQQRRASGDPANVSALACSLHCGTHVDAPAHFFDGEPGVDTVPIDALIGPAWVVDALGQRGDIDPAALAALEIPDGAARVLFKTGNSALWDAPRFTEDFVALTPGPRPPWPSAGSGSSASTTSRSPATPTPHRPTRRCYVPGSSFSRRSTCAPSTPAGGS